MAALGPGRKVVLQFDTSQFGARKCRLVRFVTMSMPTDYGYVLEVQAEDAMGAFHWSRETQFPPRSPVATLIQMYVDKERV